MPDLMDGIMALWTNAAKQSKGNLERTTAVEVARSREKAWIDSEADFNSRAITESM